MISRILLGATTRRGLAAARVAVDLAAGLGTRLQVGVVEDGRLAETMAAVSGAGGLRERRGDAAAAVLEHVGELARRRRPGRDLPAGGLPGPAHPRRGPGIGLRPDGDRQVPAAPARRRPLRRRRDRAGAGTPSSRCW